MEIKILTATENETVLFATEELTRYLYMIDKSLKIEVERHSFYDASAEGIWLLCDSTLAPSVNDASMDDAYRIEIKDNCGFIAGTNPISVLIGTYALLKTLGCSWIRPGKDGEIITERTLSPINLSVTEVAEHRFRGINLDCDSSVETAVAMIDWLPKYGMNNYFFESLVPEKFFKSYYKDGTQEVWLSAFDTCKAEAKKRGIKRHAVGHGWHMAAIGWRDYHKTRGISLDELSKEQISSLALVGGKRRLYGDNGNIFSTQLCYSKEHIRKSMINEVVKYLKSNTGIDYLHFWLADGLNNHCECDECKRMRPSDWYVMMLNDLDKRLANEGIDTKIVCLIYVDLLWEPEVLKIENPDRFILMFAPITRTYDKGYSVTGEDCAVKTPYVRNDLTWPRNANENALYLKDWQKNQLKGDSFLFDYHLMWNQYKDPGYDTLSRIIHEDMKNLGALGLSGSVSCEIYNCQIPHDFPHVIMARTLWSTEIDYDREQRSYFALAYGEDYMLACEYLKRISKLFSVIYRYYTEGDKCKEEQRNLATRVKNLVSEFECIVSKNIEKPLPRAQKISWELLKRHGEYVTEFARAYTAKYMGDKVESDKHLEAFEKVCDRLYADYESYINLYYVKFSVRYYCDEITEGGANVVLQ